MYDMCQSCIPNRLGLHFHISNWNNMYVCILNVITWDLLFILFSSIYYYLWIKLKCLKLLKNVVYCKRKKYINNKKIIILHCCYSHDSRRLLRTAESCCSVREGIRKSCNAWLYLWATVQSYLKRHFCNQRLGNHITPSLIEFSSLY